MNKNSIHTTSPVALLQRQELLLRMEYETEKETFRQQTEAMGIGRKVKRGKRRLWWKPSTRPCTARAVTVQAGLEDNAIIL